MYFNLNKTDKIYFEKIGNSNKTILILPGWGNTRETFKYITSYFSKDYTIYIIDYPGFGNSPTINKELTIYDYAQIINKLIKKEKIINPIIIAHSFGGRLSAILLGKYNLKVEKIILIDVAGIKRRKTLKQFLKEKTYKYIINLGEYNPIERNYVFQYNYKLDIKAIREGIKYFEGTHDFRAFVTDNKEKENCVRTITLTNIEEKDNKLIITFKGDGFLRYQVINI